MKGTGETSRTAKAEEASVSNPEFGNEEVASRENDLDLLGSLEEIEKLDAVIKMKLTEERKAKLSRLQAEEESRDVLSNLPSSKMPDRVKLNAEQFMKLLNEAVEQEADSSPCLKLNDLEVVGGEKPENAEEGKGGKTSCQQTSSLTFVERNIQLAKCGRGTLSLTDEEKTRIEDLLVDVEKLDSKTAAVATAFIEAIPKDKEDFYVIDRETKSILGEIDQRLEALAKFKSPKNHEREEDLLEKSVFEKNGADGGGKQGSKRGREREKKKKKGNRLEEINKLLNSMNSASDEEIMPLPEEELESLIEQAKRNLTAEAGGGSGDGAERPEPKLQDQVIAELVSGAKFLMPKFKYRFDEG